MRAGRSLLCRAPAGRLGGRSLLCPAPAGRALSTVLRSGWAAAGGHSLLCRAPAGQLRAGRVPLGHARLADSTPGAGCFPLSAPARRRRDRQARPVPCGGPGPPAPPAGICWAGYANRRPVAQAFGRLPLAVPETALRLPEGRSEPGGLGDVLCNTNPSATPKTGVESARRACPTGAAPFRCMIVRRKTRARTARLHRWRCGTGRPAIAP
ncbi:hypothetical protein HRbin33_00880 [bacterium HR33]|nr:hypothetical protein HRbin33_00880 [bacterium HR33]